MNSKSINHSNLLKSNSHYLSKFSIWNNLNIFFLTILFFLSIFFIFSFFSSHVQYQVVCNKLSSEDSFFIISKLITMKIPYHYIVDSGELLVPENDILKVYSMLLTEGLPKKKNLGFELIDQEKFGMSPLHAQINYQRALEGELSRSIETMHFVKTAQVHISFPEASSFEKRNICPSASVILGFKNGKCYNFVQCHAIADLVAASVPGLLSKNVIILDEHGNYLNRKNIFLNQTHNLQWYTVRSLERYFCKNITYLLEPIIQLKNFRVQVHIFQVSDIHVCKHQFFFHDNKQNMLNNIYIYLFSMFKKNVDLQIQSGQKYNGSVLVLVNYLKNKNNQLVPLNTFQIGQIKGLISMITKSFNVNFKSIKLINMKFDMYKKSDVF
ncbi:flagellar basal-body MS-ring/collar protein FliF [Buchnera aphidicola]|nr:flagellar basal-body MS-ring/collar protein FliF [Buchnera aphidicola]